VIDFRGGNVATAGTCESKSTLELAHGPEDWAVTTAMAFELWVLETESLGARFGISWGTL